MKRKKPGFTANSAYIARAGRVDKSPPTNEWYTPLFTRFKSLSRRDVIILSVVASLLVLLLWRPPIEFIAACIIVVILMTVIVNGSANWYDARDDTEIVTPWVGKVEDLLEKRNELKWIEIESNGGPLLLLSKDLLPFWEGTDNPSKGRVVEAKFRWQGLGAPTTDYDSACDVEGYLGLIAAGEGQGLVLGKEQMLTAWWPANDAQSGGILI